MGHDLLERENAYARQRGYPTPSHGIMVHPNDRQVMKGIAGVAAGDDELVQHAQC